MNKREALTLQREMDKLDKSLGGIKDMDGLPDALFVIDVGYHKIAITEATKLGIPIVAVVDTNHSPIGIAHVIPGNDDSSRAIRLYARGAADAILEGRSDGDPGDRPGRRRVRRGCRRRDRLGTPGRRPVARGGHGRRRNDAAPARCRRGGRHMPPLPRQRTQHGALKWRKFPRAW